MTSKQEKFVREYLVDLNGTQAAIRAGYSKHTANEQAAQLLAKVSISEAVAKAQAAQSERTEITADKVLAELAKIGFADTAEAFEGLGFRVSDKRAALVDIGKHLGMFPTKLEHTGKEGGPIEVSEVSPLERARRIAFALNTAQPDTQPGTGNGLTKH